MVPEELDVTEIDKLTGVPKPKGKDNLLNNIPIRSTAVCYSYVGALHNYQHL